MASSPTYGERPHLQGFRRSFTVPHRQLSAHERAGLSDADAGSETLFIHPSVRIISFAPPPESVVSRSKATNVDADYPIDTVETLPWRSRSEDLAASGRMIIEKVRGSVWFLKCGSQFVYSILRNSQCWCVDGESKFVWRKGRLQYYRLELPTTTEEERAKVEELKAAFAKVLKFEKTPCPFKRGFHVDLPDNAITPRRKGKWTKKDGSLPNTPDSNTPPLRRARGSRSWSSQAQSPLPVPESRRQSDHDFVRRLYPTPLRRSTGSVLRPGTPPSNDSSDETTGQDRQDEYSDDESILPDQSPREEELLGNDTLASFDLEHEIDSRKETDMSLDDSGLEDSTVLYQKLLADVCLPILPASDASLQEVPQHANEVSSALPKLQKRSNGETSSGEDESVHMDNLLFPSADEDSENAQYTSGGPISEQSAKEGIAHKILGHDETPQEIPELAPTLAEESTPLEAAETEMDRFQSMQDTSLPQESPFKEDSHPQREETSGHEDEDDPGEGEVQAEVAVVDDPLDDTASIASTAESFHTVASEDPELLQEASEPTSLASRLGAFDMRQYQHKRGISEMTITASSYDKQNMQDQRPNTPILVQSSASDDSWPDIKTPSNFQDGLRQRLKLRRSLSPVPSSGNVFSPQAPNHGNHMTSVLLQKACNVALVKPIEVVVLVVHIIVRIAGGASLNDLLTGELFKRPEKHRRNSSFPDRMPSRRDDDEDDYGVPLRGRRSSSAPKESTTARDADADSLFDLD